MADDKFKLPRSSYEELSKIIKAYGKSSKLASNNDISKLSGIGATHISANNAFLLAVGILEGGNLKNSSVKGNQLARALEHEIPDEVLKAWKTIVEENEFLNKMVQAVGVRKGMEILQLENHIAYSAGEAKSKYVMTGSRTIVDILLASGLVQQDGDKILPSINLQEQNKIYVKGIQQVESKYGSQNPLDVSLKVKYGELMLHIELRINATPSELDGLGEKIRKLIKDLSSENEF